MSVKYDQLKRRVFPRSEWKNLENRSLAVNEIGTRIVQITCRNQY